jgi:hypothetical protein
VLFECSIEGNDNKMNKELAKEIKTPQYTVILGVIPKISVPIKFPTAPIPHTKIAKPNHLIPCAEALPIPFPCSFIKMRCITTALIRHTMAVTVYSMIANKRLFLLKVLKKTNLIWYACRI